MAGVVALVTNSSMRASVRERALGVLSRAVKDKSGRSAVLECSGLEAMLASLGQDFGLGLPAQEHALRALALVASDNAGAEAFVRAGGPEAVLPFLSSESCTAAGNAALCVGLSAKSKKHLPQLGGAVEPLITLMKRSGNDAFDPAKQNAAVALARVASCPLHLPLVRKLDGISLMYRVGGMR